MVGGEGLLEASPSFIAAGGRPKVSRRQSRKMGAVGGEALMMNDVEEMDIGVGEGCRGSHHPPLLGKDSSSNLHSNPTNLSSWHPSDALGCGGGAVGSSCRAWPYSHILAHLSGMP